ncbi:putative protein K02A2.6-like protein [Labeo rohita]|uniref:Integrase catalytic domain-containing protein n=1 Tax=Labeo rohita TaxID=84645 RepID=A0A498LY68_LABRO|nr:putative protein K02A2.6-like protein [Labeo rohita]
MVVVDYYSRYYEYGILKSTTADKVIDCLEEVFSRHGLPCTIRSDCGPQFMSTQFQQFCETNGIQHVKTTPRWAQANGEVERQNASILKRIRIAQAEGLDWRKELRKYVAMYRAIDHNTTGKSPAELLFNRKIRGKLPDFTMPRNDQEIRDRDAEQKGKNKLYADHRRGAKYSQLEVGDQVLADDMMKEQIFLCSACKTLIAMVKNMIPAHATPVQIKGILEYFCGKMWLLRDYFAKQDAAEYRPDCPANILRSEP